MCPPHADVRPSSPQGKWILLTTVPGAGTVLLGSTVVDVALPRLGRELDTGLTAPQWTVNACMVTPAGLILLGGVPGDRFGPRVPLTAGPPAPRVPQARERGGAPRWRRGRNRGRSAGRGR